MSVREDILEETIVRQLKTLIIDEAQATKLKVQWKKNQVQSNQADVAKSLELRIADETTRLNRLTDLLIDGVIDQSAYQTREHDGRLRLAELREELAQLPDLAEQEVTHMNFLELMKSLARLHIMAEPSEKRIIVENCFSNRTVIGKDVYLEPHNWLEEIEMASPVCVGAHLRDTSRTIIPMLDILNSRQSRQDDDKGTVDRLS